MPDIVHGSPINQPLVGDNKVRRQSNAYQILTKDASREEHSQGDATFMSIYGISRSWLLFIAVSGALGPVARVCAQGTRHLLVPDMALVGASCLVILSIGHAIDSPIFATMYKRNKYPSHPLYKASIMVMVLISVIRPVVIYLFADQSWSHLGGLFVGGTLCVVLPFAKVCVDVCQNAANEIVDHIESQDHTAHWPDIFRRIVMLRGDMELFWDMRAAGGPWCLILFTEAAGAAVFGLRFLARQSEHRWAGIFFAFVLLLLATLWPLAHITETCANKSSMSKSITAAATRWYFPAHGKDVDLNDKEYRSYQMVLLYLQHNQVGVVLAGMLVRKQLLTEYGARVVVGVPTLFRMMTAVAASHSASVLTGVEAHSSAHNESSLLLW